MSLICWIPVDVVAVVLFVDSVDVDVDVDFDFAFFRWVHQLLFVAVSLLFVSDRCCWVDEFLTPQNTPQKLQNPKKVGQS